MCGKNGTLQRDLGDEAINVKFIQLIALTIFLFGCGETVPRTQNPGILSMGDSLLAWNSFSGHSVSDAIESNLGELVVDRSVIGAGFLYNLPISGAAGLNIAKQYRPGSWDWIILNGGGNDLWFRCGCNRCDRTIERMISKDGQSGEIPNLVFRLRATGARVIYVGYLHSPGAYSIVDRCKDEVTELESRIAILAKEEKGTYYLKLADLVPKGDLSYHDVDRIHPSIKASAEIGMLVSRIISRQRR